MHDPHPRPAPPLAIRFDWGLFLGLASAILVGNAVATFVTRQWGTGLIQLALGALGLVGALLLFHRRERRHIVATQAWFDEEISRRRATSQQLVENEEWQP